MGQPLPKVSSATADFTLGYSRVLPNGRELCRLLPTRAGRVCSKNLGLFTPLVSTVAGRDQIEWLGEGEYQGRALFKVRLRVADEQVCCYEAGSYETCQQVLRQDRRWLLR